MNLPNKLTLTRAILILPMVVLLHLEPVWCRWVALAIFVIASVTDFLDGQIARKHNLVTNFGKFLDPVADKLLVLSGLISLCGAGQVPSWLCVVIVCRELCVDGLRLIAREKGITLAAGMLGKIKTNVQMVTTGFCMVRMNEWFALGETVKWVLVILCAVMTLLSGIDYFVKNRSVFDD